MVTASLGSEIVNDRCRVKLVKLVAADSDASAPLCCLKHQVATFFGRRRQLLACRAHYSVIGPSVLQIQSLNMDLVLSRLLCCANVAQVDLSEALLAR